MFANPSIEISRLNVNNLEWLLLYYSHDIDVFPSINAKVIVNNTVMTATLRNLKIKNILTILHPVE